MNVVDYLSVVKNIIIVNSKDIPSTDVVNCSSYIVSCVYIMRRFFSIRLKGRWICQVLLNSFSWACDMTKLFFQLALYRKASKIYNIIRNFY